MPDQDATDPRPDSVSREAHERVLRERDELKAKLDEAATALRDLTLVDKARRIFAEKGVDDPDWAAEIALPHLRTVDKLDKIAEVIDQRFAKLIPTTQTSDTTSSDQQTAPPPPDVDATPAPPFARPNPAAEGAPPNGQRQYYPTDPEIERLIQGPDGKQVLERLEKEGVIKWRTAPPAVPG